MRYLLLALVAFALGLTLIAATAPTKNQPQIARGDYLVNRVAMCVDCHTPMLRNGQPNKQRQLAGARLPFKATVKMPFVTVAPNLTGAGLVKGWSAKQFEHFLMTGKTPNNERADLPMPQYRLNPADANAAVVYIRSLPPIKP